MAISQPVSTDKLNSPDHSLMHRQIASDPAAPVQSLTITSAGNLAGTCLQNTNPTNLLSNGNFENWSAGASSLPDSWELDWTAGAYAREATIIKTGTYSFKLSSTATNTGVCQNITSPKGITYWKGRTLTFSCWVYATVASRARIGITDDDAVAYSSYHTGDSTWQLLTVTRTIGVSGTSVKPLLRVAGGNTSVYFDEAMCVEGESAFAFSDKPGDSAGLKGTFVANGTTPVTISNINVAITDAIIISLNTVGGTVGVQPHVATITAGTGFTVVCTASDTSTYNYYLVK